MASGLAEVCVRALGLWVLPAAAKTPQAFRGVMCRVTQLRSVLHGQHPRFVRDMLQGAMHVLRQNLLGCQFVMVPKPIGGFGLPPVVTIRWNTTLRLLRQGPCQASQPPAASTEHHPIPPRGTPLPPNPT